MKKTKQPTRLFVAWAKNDGEYSHFQLSVFERNPFSETDMFELCSLRWQSDRSDRAAWYGLHVLVDHDGRHAPTRLSRASHLVAKLLPEDHRPHNPDEVLARLSAFGIGRGAYDSRLSQYVREVDAPPAYLDRYVDDYKAQGAQSCAVSALARDETQAKAAIERAFAESILKGHTSGERLAQWIGAGKPVLVAYGSHPPHFPSMATLLNVPETPEVAA